MTLNIYLVLDERGNEFGTPLFTDKSPEELESDYSKSVRGMDAMIEFLQPKDEKDKTIYADKLLSLIGRRAELQDSVVYHVGTFDSITGEFSIFEKMQIAFRIKEVM